MFKKIVCVLMTALIVLSAATGCGQKSSAEQSSSQEEGDFQSGVARLEKLGDLESKELLQYSDGMVNITYDGNTFIPTSLDEISSGLYELIFGPADVETEDNDTFGYFLYGTGIFDIEDIEEIYDEEISFYFGDSDYDFLEVKDYEETTAENIFRTFEWVEGEQHKYGLLAVRNEEGNTRIAQFLSDDSSIIQDKAIKMVESFEFVDGGKYNATLLDQSFERTEAIYDMFYPEEMEEYRKYLEEQNNSETSYVEYQTADDVIDNTVNGKAMGFTDFKLYLSPGEEYDLELIGTAVEDGVTYMSTDSEIVTTDQSGHIVAAAEGSAAIVAYTDYGAMAKAYIYVTEPTEDEEAETESTTHD